MRSVSSTWCQSSTIANPGNFGMSCSTLIKNVWSADHRNDFTLECSFAGVRSEVRKPKGSVTAGSTEKGNALYHWGPEKRYGSTPDADATAGSPDSSSTDHMRSWRGRCSRIGLKPCRRRHNPAFPLALRVRRATCLRNQSYWTHRLIQRRLGNQSNRAQLTKSDLRGSAYTTSASSSNESGFGSQAYREASPGHPGEPPPPAPDPPPQQRDGVYTPVASSGLTCQSGSREFCQRCRRAAWQTLRTGPNPRAARYREPANHKNVRRSFRVKQKSKLRLITHWTVYVWC